MPANDARLDLRLADQPEHRPRKECDGAPAVREPMAGRVEAA
jgi:hypothetical protein